MGFLGLDSDTTHTGRTGPNTVAIDNAVEDITDVASCSAVGEQFDVLAKDLKIEDSFQVDILVQKLRGRGIETISMTLGEHRYTFRVAR